MTHSEQEEILRRALHAVADQIEPAADGLERIRERLSRPRPLAVAWLMAGWTGTAQPLLLRMEPVLAEAAGRLSGRLAEWPRPAIEWLLAAIRALRPRSGMSRHEKLRSALAFAAAALIGTVGGLALSEGLTPVISAASSFFSSGPPSTHGVTNDSGQHGVPSASGAGTNTRHKSSPITTPNALRRPRPARPPRHRRPPPHRRPSRHRRPGQHSHRHADPEPGRGHSFALHQPHLSSQRQL